MARENKVPAGFPGITRNEEEQEKWRREKTSDERLFPDGMEEAALLLRRTYSRSMSRVERNIGVI